ncbi:MAG: hypothetical protein DYH06_10020, partial [Acidobacteria bacterium ACB2]|nr:hypothetical protein [Acidobacteria bacterium ACB2]
SGPEFRQLTFDRGRVTAARFAPDGHTVVYSAAWAGAPPQVFSVRLDARESLPLGYEGAELLAVSRTSELALALGTVRPSWSAQAGTLARAPFSGGTPRSLEERIVGADFGPDGESMAVVRLAETRPPTWQLEYPVGTVLFRTPGWISSARVSRRGDAVAFVEHPEPESFAGHVSVAEPGGKVRRLTERFALPVGLAWSPSGDEVWFSAARTGTDLELRAVPLRGKERRLFAQGGSLLLHDVSPDGRVLASVEEATSRISFRGENDASDRDLSWTGSWSTLGPLSLSHDGRQLLFSVIETEQLFLRRTDGSPPSRIANRVAGSKFPTLSPDGRNVVIVQRGGPDPLLIDVVPTGPGPTRTIRLEGFEAFQAGLLPDGRTVWFAGRKGSGGARYWLTDPSGTSPRPATPELEGVSGPWVTPDGRHFLGRKGAAFALFPIDGGEPTAVRGVTYGEDYVQGISMDSRFFFVQQALKPRASLRRVDVVTGATVAVREISPSDPAGVTNVWVQVTPDGKSLASLTWRFLSKLYAVEGFR